MRVQYTEREMERLQGYCKRHKLKIKKFIAKGHSSRIFLVQRGRKKLVAKLERDDSTRRLMLEKEVFSLKIANSVKVGPKLLSFDFFDRVLLMEFIDGLTFQEWLFEKKRKKAETKKFIAALQKQAGSLDEIGLDHGQLAGRGANILVRKGMPVIIDFEKASIGRKCHNKAVLEAFLFRNKRGAVAKRVSKLLR